MYSNCSKLLRKIRQKFCLRSISDSLFPSRVFRDYHLEDDPTSLHPVALAAMALQALYGTIPRVYGKGRAARQVGYIGNNINVVLF